jgi:hypothetical protein
MKVFELPVGTRFRINAKVYVLQRKPTSCAALVEMEAGDRTVKIKDSEFTVPGVRRFHIAPTAEVDEVLGMGEVHTKDRKEYVNEIEEAKKAIARAERKERAKEREQADQEVA